MLNAPSQLGVQIENYTLHILHARILHNTSNYEYNESFIKDRVDYLETDFLPMSESEYE